MDVRDWFRNGALTKRNAAIAALREIIGKVIAGR
jgi:hypothetical protein